MPEELKLKRLQEIIAVFRENMLIRNKQTEDGRIRLVLIEGMSSKATAEEAVPLMTGRTDGNKRVLFNTIPSQLLFTPFDHTHLRRVQSIFKKTPNASDIFTTNTAIEDDVNDLYAHLLDEPKSASHTLDGTTNSNINSQRYATVDELRGKYAVVHMYNANGQTLRGRVLGLTSMKDFHHTLYPSLLAE